MVGTLAAPLGAAETAYKQAYDAAAAQIDLARRGMVLASVDAETHSDIATTAPANDTGAQLRAAYWLAVAARIALFRGQNAAADALLSEARAYLGKAQTAALPIVGTLLGWGRGTHQIQAILNEAIRTAIRNGVPDVVPHLMTLADPKAVQKSVEQSESESLRGWLTDPAAMARAAFWDAIKVPVYLFGALALVGLGIWAWTALRKAP